MPPMSFVGVVTKVGCMNKTATVTVSRWVVHKTTGKRIERSKKFLTHDEKNQLRLDDTVLIRNCPPISARKRFMLEKILKSPETERELAHAHKEPTAEQSTAASPSIDILGMI
ncbi:nucleic acid-binding protein [Gloeophyllum trabeum ATCC 11539]|uniref:Nucleic acid-binding protein n=1 Tax=Gloeophyllum trabeum (strain ATCC 11539 / FP-39264 / Madison 617) TaxID=670483 RepID=S7S1M7_GLOTA|nr:nucleic acid-binding protein [Gloeophyllum trabeum ATCC 11539]EPQ61355.1 nucleic acid-binding protein [Gloeophyllum trabeum ATCC 11539]